jgi:hypothetical protein
MKVELKTIVDQLTEACEMENGLKVSALIDQLTDQIVGWTVVRCYDDGTIVPYDKSKFNNIKELIEYYRMLS